MLKLYRSIGLLLAIIFALVGMLFLLFPDTVLGFFNRLSPYFALPAAPLAGSQFFQILAVAYMYLVTVLAWKMYSQPAVQLYPQLLIQAKAVSSLVSLAVFLQGEPYLIYLANFIIDGGISLLVATMLVLQRWQRKC